MAVTRKPGSGNRTSKRGRKLVRHIPISEEASRSLRVLLGSSYSQEAISRWVEEQIAAAWEAYDARIQADVEAADEGGWYG